MGRTAAAWSLCSPPAHDRTGRRARRPGTRRRAGGLGAKRDPDDTQGRLKRVASKSQGTKLSATITTWDAFTAADLQGWTALGSRCSKVAVKRVTGTTVRVTVARAKVAQGAWIYRWRGGSFAPQGVAGCDESPFCLDSRVSNPHKWFRLRA